MLKICGTSVMSSKQCDQKKSSNVYKSNTKMISLEKMIDFDTFTKVA